MRPWLAPLLVLGLALTGPAAGADEPQDGTDPELQQEMQRLDALRTRDPQAFVAQARSLESLPAPTTVAQREFLEFLRANRATFEGRFADAIALAKPLAETAEDPALRLRAGSFVVNMQAGTRDFEDGLRLLSTLLKAHPKALPGMEEEQQRLWGVAATFYQELGQHALAIEYAKRVLDDAATVQNDCAASVVQEMARLDLKDSSQRTDDFTAAAALCRSAENRVGVDGFLPITEVRFLRQRGQLKEALSLLERRFGAIESTRYPRLVAEAYALDAELLLADERYVMAGKQAREALRLGKDLPTGLPVMMAEKVLYELARRAGDSQAALGHLQRHVAASQALAEEARIKELAFRTVQHEVLESEQQLVLTGERNRVLALQAQAAQAESRNALLLALLLGGGVLGAAVWTVRLIRQERRFRALSQTDALTGFANRAHFAALATSALARAATDGRRAALISFDLDHFKAVNDRHGHLAGDAVLRSVSAAVRSVQAEAGLRSTVGRMGGEEFALLLEGATPEQAHAHADACRKAIVAAQTALDDGQLLNVTASFGVADADTCGYALNPLLAASDRSLYHAKNDGRNRVAAPATPAMQAA